MQRSSPLRAAAGFTLVELVAVLILTAILGVVALPRMVQQSAFDSRGFADSTRAAVQHARRVAIAQRRTACASFDGVTLGFTQSSNFGGACDLPLADPAGSAPLSVRPPAGIQLTVSPAAFSFDPLGRPSAAVTLTISGAGSLVILVEADSGYVH